jgi:hypothetical protein
VAHRTETSTRSSPDASAAPDGVGPEAAGSDTAVASGGAVAAVAAAGGGGGDAKLWPLVVDEHERRLLRWEIVAVFSVSLGASAVSAFVSLIGSLTAHASLHAQQTVLNGTPAPGRPLLSLFLELVSLASGAAPVLLVCYLLARSGEGVRAIGFDLTQPVRDVTRGAVLAAVIGFSGLGLYLLAFKAGISVNVVAENLPDVWWRIPALLLSALQNGALEEVLVLGYLVSRLRRLGVRPQYAILISATLRGSYHLYQGFGGFIGNAILGVIFATLFLRWKRMSPMLVAHTLIDAVAFVGYALLVGHVSWLP